MFFSFIIPIVLWVSICGVCFATLARLLTWLYTNAILFSRITFALLIGAVLTQNGFSVVENGTLNYVIAAGVSLVALFLLNLFTRTSWATKFCSTLLISYFVTLIAYLIAVSLVGMFFGDKVDQKFLSEVGECVIWFGSLAFSIKQTWEEIALFADFLVKYEGSKISVTVDRVLASLIYGFSIALFLVIRLNERSFTDFEFLAIWGIVGVIAYLVDIIMVKKYIERHKDDMENVI